MFMHCFGYYSTKGTWKFVDIHVLRNVEWIEVFVTDKMKNAPCKIVGQCEKS